MVESQQRSMPVEVDALSQALAVELLGDHHREPLMYAGMHHKKSPDSYFGLDHRPPELAWAGVLEILTWAEMDRPLCREGTPSLCCPRSGHRRSAPNRIRFDVNQVVRTSVHEDGEWIAWVLHKATKVEDCELEFSASG